MVELLRRYANRADLLHDLNRAVARLDGWADVQDVEERPDAIVSDCPPNPHERLLSERLTADDVAVILAKYRAYVPIESIAQEFNVGKTSLKRLLREHGGRPKDARYTPEMIDKVIQLYRDGGTIRGLAAEFGIGTTIKNWIRERGVGRGRW